MNKDRLSLPICFEVNNEVFNADERFIHVAIDVLHTGLNFNGSIFDKEIVNENIDTIKNTPILGFISEDSYNGKDFNGHEYIITKTDKDGVTRKYIGSAYGVVPESCNPRWITKMCDDGQEREFLQVDGILWTKFKDSAEIMLRDIEKPHSMELFPDNIEGYEDDDGNFVFTGFSFDGCCILGTSKEPAMINSTVEVQFTMSDFVKSIQSELNDKFIAFTKMVNEKTNQGGIRTMQNTDFTQTVLQQFEDISTMVREYETMRDRWGDSIPRYYAVDIQESEVIVVDRESGYNYFGFTFTINGDKPEIDFTSGKRKKLRYEDYEEGSAPEGAFDFGKHITKIEDTAFAKVEEANAKVADAEGKISEYETKVSEFEVAKNEIEEKYNQVNAEFEEMKPKYEDYVKAEQARMEAELEAQKDAEFAKYEEFFKDDVNFSELKENKAEKSLKEIESELAIMFARKSLANPNFSKSNDGAMVAGIVDGNDDKDGFVAHPKYGLIRKS